MHLYNIVQKLMMYHIHFNNGIAINSMWLSWKQKIKGYKIIVVSKDHFLFMLKLYLSQKTMKILIRTLKVILEFKDDLKWFCYLIFSNYC